jgi:hypothetical protein
MFISERLQLTSNTVGGEIPSELGQLSNLGMYKNSMANEGEWFETERRLTYISLSSGFLSLGRCGNIRGTLPTELGRLGSLSKLLISSASFVCQHVVEER